MKRMTTKAIERRAEEVLDETDSFTLPVPVDSIALDLGMEVEVAPLGEDISGLLVVKDDRGMIGVNHSHPLVRQRFTVAHEIGHFLLHRGEEDLFIEKGYSAVFRDSKASSGKDTREIQANQFAAALLMPRELVLREVDLHGIDLGDESVLDLMAGKFLVSTQAMSFRLSNLGVFG